MSGKSSVSLWLNEQVRLIGFVVSEIANAGEKIYANVKVGITGVELIVSDQAKSNGAGHIKALWLLKFPGVFTFFHSQIVALLWPT